MTRAGDDRTPARRRSHARLAAAIGVLALVASACGWFPRAPVGPGRVPGIMPVGALSHDGRWLTDATGRIVLVHGVNEVAKSAPYTPASIGFDDDDAAFLARSGFTAVRVGVEFQGLMPRPGAVDPAYLDQIAATVRTLARHHVYALLDFHQDEYGPVTHGNGFPAWATITDGLPNPEVPFPLSYVENPALQRAFDHFWADSPGPGGVGLQEYYAQGMRAVAQRFAHDPSVLGYEVMNEPWPGSTFESCLTGCPDLEQRLLVPFYRKMADTVRSVDRTHLLFVEPFVLFNFGTAATSLPAFGAPGNGLSVHEYALSPANEVGVLQHALDASGANGDAVVVTEWGATNDPAAIQRQAGELDGALLPWMFWAYNENVIVDGSRPPTPDNLRAAVVDALVRPYPVATAGTPASLSFDPGSSTLSYAYSTRRPDGRRSAPWLLTAISTPPGAYPSGYTVGVSGARVVSPPCAPVLALLTDPGAGSVQVTVTPGGRCS